eukprot:jgi/Mesvir1/27267/Mv07103-RA.1
MRRTTLASLSPSQLNSRAGQNGAGRESGLGTKTANKRMTLGSMVRNSLAGPTPGPGGQRHSAGQAPVIPRRSSTVGRGSATGARSDARPITDKAFQASCIRSVIAFLTTHGYEHTISPKILASPTGKDFTNIIQFLFRHVDPNMKFELKMEEEVPVMFKRLHYPFQISKSALQAVGSPHTWPSLLAAIAWLVELLTYDEKAESCRMEEVFDAENGHRLFFDFVSRSYRHFLEGDDYNCSRLQSELASTFEVRDSDLAAEVAAMEEDGARLQAELDRLRAEPSSLTALQAKHAALSTDIEKFRVLLDNLSQHKAAAVARHAEKASELAAKEADLAALVRENGALRERVAAQDYNLADIERMSMDKKKEEGVLAAVTGQRDALQKDMWDMEVQASRRLEDLEALVRSYNVLAGKLKLTPATAKRAQGSDYELSLNTRASRAEDMLSLDLKGVVRPELERMRDEAAARGRDCAAALVGVKEAYHAAHDKCAERREENEAMVEGLRKMDARFKAARDKAESDLKASEVAVERIVAHYDKLKGAAMDVVIDKAEAHKKAMEEHDALLAECEREKEALNNKLLAALDMLMTYKAHVQAELRGLHQFVQGAREECKQATAQLASYTTGS